MDFPWGSSSYLEVLDFCLGFKNSRRPKGAVAKFANSLKCHPSFVAQVLGGRAHLSLEQGILAAKYFNFSDEEGDFFLMMLSRDRAGTAPLKKYFQGKMDDIQEERKNLSPKPDVQSLVELGTFESEYFSNWIYSLVHALVQIDSFQDIDSLALKLSIPKTEIQFVLARLKVMGLVDSDQQGQRWRSLEGSLHLSKDSPYLRTFFLSWKSKILSDFQFLTSENSTRYSGVITLSENDFQLVRGLLVETINKIRQLVSESRPERASVLSIDCYDVE